MLKSSKILLIFFLFTSAFLFLVLEKTLAAPAVPEVGPDVNDLKPNLQILIGNTTINFGAIQPCSDDSGYWCIGWIGQYIGAVYRYGVGLAAVLAVVMIMAGGFLWLVSAGSPERVSKARDFIISALSGLLLALFSFIILYTVNPRLAALEGVRVRKITEAEQASLAGGAAEEQIDTVQVQCCVCLDQNASIGDNQCFDGITEEQCRSFNRTERRPLGQGDNADIMRTLSCGIVVGSHCQEIAECRGQIQKATDNEQSVRNQFEYFGITTKPPCVNGQTVGCVNLEGLPASAASGLIQLQKEVGTIFITGGTEGGHRSHGPGIPTVDLRYHGYENIQNYVSENGTPVNVGFGNQSWRIGDTLFVDEGSGDNRHWHVEFQSSRLSN